MVYMSKAERMALRSAHSTEVNRTEVKTSLRDKETRSQRRQAMREKFKNSSMYAKHMPWLSE